MYEWPFTYYSLTPCSGKLQRVAIREMKNLRTIHCKSFKLWINCNNYDFVCPEIPAEQHPIRHNVGEGKREIPESIESTPPSSIDRNKRSIKETNKNEAKEREGPNPIRAAERIRRTAEIMRRGHRIVDPIHYHEEEKQSPGVQNKKKKEKAESIPRDFYLPRNAPSIKRNILTYWWTLMTSG